MMALRDEVSEILKDNSLYLRFINLDPFQETGLSKFKNLPKTEDYEIGPIRNYIITKTASGKAICEKNDSVKIKLEDVLFDESAPLEGESSSYNIEITELIEEKGKIKVKGLLKDRIDFTFVNRGTNYSRKTFIGYVKEIKKGPSSLDNIKFPDFDF